MNWIDRQIAVAILILKRGTPLPLHLAQTLWSEGIDVDALEAAYL